MNAKTPKRLPWTFHDSLGYGGKRIDLEKAKSIVRRVGVDAFNDSGDTPLSVAAMLGRTEMVQWLLDGGADIEYVAPMGYFETALFAAVYQQRAEVVELLLSRGANPDTPNHRGHTPLLIAFANCHTDPRPTVTLLIQYGARVTAQVIASGESWNIEAFRELLATVQRKEAG